VARSSSPRGRAPKTGKGVSNGGPEDLAAPERLLAAAVEAFGQRGYHATTTREIAERAGMSPAGMYIHFQSKQEILYQVSRFGHAAVLEVVEDALAGDAPPEEQVRRFVQAFTAWHAWNHRSARVQQYELHALAREHFDEIRSLRSRFGHMLKQELRRGVQSGIFTIGDLDTTALAILSLGIDVARWYRPGIDPEPDALGQAYADLVLMMLGVQPG
jgi:AcrR family transcriptional regulator